MPINVLFIKKHVMVTGHMINSLVASETSEIAFMYQMRIKYTNIKIKNDQYPPHIVYFQHNVSDCAVSLKDKT